MLAAGSDLDEIQSSRGVLEATANAEVRGLAQMMIDNHTKTTADAAAAARCAGLRGLAPVTIVSAQIDPLRSDGETLMTALRAANLPVARRVYDGEMQDFFSMADVVADARDPRPA